MEKIQDYDIGKSERHDDGFYDLVFSERTKAKEIFDTIVKDPIHPEDKKIFKVKKVFKYPIDVGKIDRSNIKKLQVSLDEETLKAEQIKSQKTIISQETLKIQKINEAKDILNAHKIIKPHKIHKVQKSK